MDNADLVMIGGEVLTVDHDFTVAQAVALAQGKVVATGSDADILALAGRRTRVVELEGRTVLPGTNDSHLHGAGYGTSLPPLEVDDPSGPPGYGARVLVIGWGSTYGPISAACRRVRDRGLAIAQAHLRHLNPLPADLPAVLPAYDTVLVPEMNLGQLATLLRASCVVDTIGYTQTRGLPFQAAELERVFTSVIKGGRTR